MNCVYRQQKRRVAKTKWTMFCLPSQVQLIVDVFYKIILSDICLLADDRLQFFEDLTFDVPKVARD